MSEAMFPKSVVMAVGEEGFKRGWTEAVDACIAAVEEFFRMPTDEQITEWVATYGEAEWFEQACLAALRKVQP